MIFGLSRQESTGVGDKDEGTIIARWPGLGKCESTEWGRDQLEVETDVSNEATFFPASTS